MSSHWSPFWSVEHGSWGLGGAFLPQSIQGMGDIFFPLKVRKDSPLEDVIHKKKNGGLEKGFKNGFVAKMVKNTKIWKNIEGDEWKQVKKLRKVISREEMVWCGRKCKWRK